MFVVKFIKQVMVLNKFLWIILIFTLYVSGRLSVSMPQIVCDHGLSYNNQALNNKTDTVTDIHNWQVKCLTNHCNASSYLEFIIKKQDRFCISWRITGHEEQYVMEYELQRLDSIMSPPFYTPVFRSVHDRNKTVMRLHCQYQRQEPQEIRLRLHPCNCSEKSQYAPPTFCPQSTVSPAIVSKKTTKHALITVTHNNTTEIPYKNVAIVVGLTILFCILVMMLVYQLKKCRKVYPVNNTTRSTNIEPHVMSYPTAYNNRDHETLNDSNCECTPQDRTSSNINLNNYTSNTDYDGITECTESRYRQSASDREPSNLQTSHSNKQFANNLPDYIQQKLMDFNKSSDSSDSELEV